jgi:hypothetical protein
MNWRDISYLCKGDEKQKEVFSALSRSKVLRFLAAFDPVLTGTYPIGIYLPGSDLDIVCEYVRPEHFETVLKISFSHYEDFEFHKKTIRGLESQIARFTSDGFRFEVFGQQQAVDDQYAYRHMIREYEILNTKDENFRKQVLALKQKGLSTEEAFASLLGIEGDPYNGLLLF